MKTLSRLVLLLALTGALVAAPRPVDCDLLIVGGSESACAAAVQAARMGVKRIVLVNDIAWLGGQFSAEALGAIDENRGPRGYDQTVPFPRNGAFLEIINRIEALNLKKYGVARPGNTRVITTCRPADAAQVFREWLAPYVRRGQIVIHDNYEPAAVHVKNGRVTGARFSPTRGTRPPLDIRAKLTIDASDWGDVIRLSGAAFEFGPDLKSKYGEPLAPVKRATHPVTDMNPITYCMVVVEDANARPIPAPPGYDARNYLGKKPGAKSPINFLEWKYPHDVPWLYESRRLVDHYKFKRIKHLDVLLLCFPAFDYPLDVWPKTVAEALERTEPGASKKNLAELNPRQRRIVFKNAKNYSLGFLHFLQTEVHDRMPDKSRSLRRFKLTDEFGTADKMPPKPYARESLRLKAMYMMRQQDTTGVGGDARNFARAMYHDSVAAWQFEYDFHPTKREFIDPGNPAGPWRGTFREGRRWGPPYSGLSVFPLRSLVPQKLNGLLAAGKNLGYSSIVSSAVRLHDQSMAIGQSSGAAAAIALHNRVRPRAIPFDRELLAQLQNALCSPLDGGAPACLWPFRDVAPGHPAFHAINLLAAQRCLPLRGDEVNFKPEEPATREWMEAVVKQTLTQRERANPVPPPFDAPTRGEFVRRWHRLTRLLPWKPFPRQTATDADGDGLADRDDALPLDAKNSSLPLHPVPPNENGLPEPLPKGFVLVRQFNLAGEQTETVKGFATDIGAVFDSKRGHGWKRDISRNHRQRSHAPLLADTFLFTRTHDTWECALPNGRYNVTLAIGDSGHEQFGQNVTVEGTAMFRNVRTPKGRFAEKTLAVTVRDGRLTVEIGLPGGTTNTCLNWIRVTKKMDNE